VQPGLLELLVAVTVAPLHIADASRSKAGAAGALMHTCLVIVDDPHGLLTVNDTVYVPGDAYW
jgi:hypothetical protein